MLELTRNHLTKEREDMKMFIWRIWGWELPALEIEAESFDEALRIARSIHIGYNSGKVVEVL